MRQQVTPSIWKNCASRTFRRCATAYGNRAAWKAGRLPETAYWRYLQTPDAGLACAKAMQERLQNPPITATRNGVTWTVKVRIGVHRAKLDMQPDEKGQYHGEDINKAARVMSQGKGGQILVSPTCHDKRRKPTEI